MSPTWLFVVAIGVLLPLPLVARGVERCFDLFKPLVVAIRAEGVELIFARRAVTDCRERRAGGAAPAVSGASTSPGC